MLENNKWINGPTNVVRLEGQIGSVHKTCWFFMDVHEPIDHQTQCSNIYSRDINQFFIKNFTKLSKSSDLTYDFFLEIQPTELAHNINIKNYAEPKMIYIEEVVKLFRKLFKYDKAKNRVSSYFKNVRLHYLDIRDYYYIKIEKIANNAFDIASNIYNSRRFETHDLDTIIDQMSKINNVITNIVELIENESDTNKKNSKKNKIPNQTLIQKWSHDDNKIKYIFNKIKYKYQHDDVAKIMDELIDVSKQMLLDCHDAGTDIIDYIKRFHKKISNHDFTDAEYRYIIVKLYNDTETHMLDLTEVFARLTDIYLLRRILDKDYITNIIAYAGGRHISYYVHILVKYFGFNVTHNASDRFTPSKLNKLISNNKSTLEQTHKLLDNEFDIQCSSVAKFPTSFN